MPRPIHPRAAWSWLGVVLRLHLVASFVLLHFLSGARADVNITLADTASQITYSPPACGLTLSSAGTGCDSSWRIVTSNASSSGTLTTTSGPDDASGGLVPQLFLTVRALGLSIKTSNDSTAIVNISVSTSTPVVSVTSQINSSIQPIEIIGLVEDRLTTLALTFEQSPNRTTFLGIDSIIVTVSDQNTAPFVSPSVPASTSLPTVTPSIVIPSPSSSSHHGQSSGDVAAEVLGAILGAVLVVSGAVLVLLFYRRRRRPRTDHSHPQDPPGPGP